MSHFTRYLIAQNESENQMTNEVIHKLYNLDLICKLQAEQEPIRFQTINLKTMIDKTLVVLEDAMSAKKISVINDVNTEVVVRFTEDHLQKIIYELLHNSVLYNLQEASIQITSQYQAEQRVELIIADTGLGILEHKQLSIFDLQEINDGTSIETCCTGLPLCKLLAQHNQADIQVDNNYQKTKVIGSIFSLYMEKE
jgi:signal transduction histidine kinase